MTWNLCCKMFLFVSSQSSYSIFVLGAKSLQDELSIIVFNSLFLYWPSFLQACWHDSPSRLWTQAELSHWPYLCLLCPLCSGSMGSQVLGKKVIFSFSQKICFLNKSIDWKKIKIKFLSKKEKGKRNFCSLFC